MKQRPFMMIAKSNIRLFSGALENDLLRVFGPRLLPFFELYKLLYAEYHGEGSGPPEEGWRETFRSMALMILWHLVRKKSQAAFKAHLQQLVQLFGRVDRSGIKGGFLIAEVIDHYVAMIDIAAKDRDVFLIQKELKYPGFVRFTRASGDQEKLLRLERDNPELAEIVKKEKEISRQLDERIEQSVRRGGLTPGRMSIRGKVVVTGTDPGTGEVVVYDRDGEVLSVEEFTKKLEAGRRATKNLRRIHPENLEELKAYPAELVDKFTEEGADPEYVALTDDNAKQNELTRVFPVVEIFGEKVICEGRFKGFSLPEMVNHVGRMIEGAGYDYDPKLGRPIKIETRGKRGEVQVTLHNNREPYITRDGGELYLKIPSTREYTRMRGAMRELSKVSPNIRYDEKSRNAVYRFTPDEFAAVRHALKSVALSKSAMDMVKDYFANVAKSELAVQTENLKSYSTKELGGFRHEKFDLYTKQKQSLAWLESRGGNGLVALDTGLGKTSVALAYIQNMRRDGLLDSPGKRVLYVCPAKLKGNLLAEAMNMTVDPDKFLEGVDEMSYAELSRAPLNLLDQYEAVIFDEAQHLKNVGNTRRGAIVNRPHPRKVLMTASPMERDPLEVRKLAAIANNEDMNSREGREEIKMFERRYCVKIGSRTVGVSDNPETQKSLRTWVKQNLFYADKQDVEEVVLPQLRRQTKSLVMPPAMESGYRERAAGIKAQLEGLTRLYRDRDSKAGRAEITGAFVKLRKEITALQRFSNMPDEAMPWLANPKIESAAEIIAERVEGAGRTLLWASSGDFADYSARNLSLKYPGTKHASGLSDRINVWRSGKILDTYRRKRYIDEDSGGEVPEDMWAKHVMDTFIKADNSVVSCTLTDSYATGQNLQQFDTVIHLERPANSEIAQQRTARAYRNGQQQSVHEYTLDAVYGDVEGEASIDEIQRYIQQMEEDLFDQVVSQSQREHLGEEFFSMPQIPASFFDTERKTLEMLMSPYMKDVRKHSLVDKQGEV